ncbi:MAG: hypothetical protein HY614_02675 [Candidatus Rokubacteria bacterium]|nr:hypothetical protein [Candidatus Rokubacteria bacterium]
MSCRVVAVVTVALGLAACAMLAPLEQRTSQGPTAEELWIYRMVLQNGREPNFDEKRHWQDDTDQRISDYLRAHPEAASSLEGSTFRFYRRATVGMSKEQLLILLGPPAGIATDAGEMEKIARRYWPTMRGNVTEAWVYPLGWSFYFAGSRIVEITQYLPR